MSFFGFGKLANITKQRLSTTQAQLTAAESPLFLNEHLVNAQLVKGDFKSVVKLPKYVDINEWLAISTFDFFNLINMFYDVVSEECTISDCPVMNAGPNHEFLWTDNQRRTVKLSAPQYIDYVLSQVHDLLEDQRVFPTRAGLTFPRDFGVTLRIIYRQLFRVVAHIYWAHIKIIANLRLEGHLNSLFAHFVIFAQEFDLLDRKELACMQDLLTLMKSKGIIQMS